MNEVSISDSRSFKKCLGIHSFELTLPIFQMRWPHLSDARPYAKVYRDQITFASRCGPLFQRGIIVKPNGIGQDEFRGQSLSTKPHLVVDRLGIKAECTKTDFR